MTDLTQEVHFLHTAPPRVILFLSESVTITYTHPFLIASAHYGQAQRRGSHVRHSSVLASRVLVAPTVQWKLPGLGRYPLLWVRGRVLGDS